MAEAGIDDILIAHPFYGDGEKICLQNNTEMYYNVNHHEELP